MSQRPTRPTATYQRQNLNINMTSPNTELLVQQPSISNSNLNLIGKLITKIVTVSKQLNII